MSAMDDAPTTKPKTRLTPAQMRQVLADARRDLNLSASPGASLAPILRAPSAEEEE